MPLLILQSIKDMEVFSVKMEKQRWRVKANISEETMGTVYAKVDQVMKGFEMPYGYSWSKGQRFRDMQESNESQMFAIILADYICFSAYGIFV